jgi:hypothetical protein
MPIPWNRQAFYLFKEWRLPVPFMRAVIKKIISLGQHEPGYTKSEKENI